MRLPGNRGCVSDRRRLLQGGGAHVNQGTLAARSAVSACFGLYTYSTPLSLSFAVLPLFDSFCTVPSLILSASVSSKDTRSSSSRAPTRLKMSFSHSTNVCASPPSNCTCTGGADMRCRCTEADGRDG